MNDDQVRITKLTAALEDIRLGARLAVAIVPPEEGEAWQMVVDRCCEALDEKVGG